VVYTGSESHGYLLGLEVFTVVNEVGF